MVYMYIQMMIIVMGCTVFQCLCIVLLYCVFDKHACVL